MKLNFKIKNSLQFKKINKINKLKQNGKFKKNTRFNISKNSQKLSLKNVNSNKFINKFKINLYKNHNTKSPYAKYNKYKNPHTTTSVIPSENSRILLLGAPGVGKGTFGRALLKQYGYDTLPIISTGEIMREEIKKGSDLGKQVKKIIDQGALVPDDLVIEVALNKISTIKTGYILDGFPRTVEQAKALEHISPIDVAVNIILDEKHLMQKIMSRRVCADCGRNYNIADIEEKNAKGEVVIKMPPLLPKVEGECDDCTPGKLEQRDDDKFDTVKNRLEVYKNETLPLVEFYTAKKKLLNFPVRFGLDDTPRLVRELNRSVLKSDRVARLALQQVDALM